MKMVLFPLLMASLMLLLISYSWADYRAAYVGLMGWISLFASTSILGLKQLWHSKRKSNLNG